MLNMVERLVIAVRHFKSGSRGAPVRIALPPGFYALYHEDLREYLAGTGPKWADASAVLDVPIMKSAGHHPSVTFSDGSELTLHLWPV